MIRFSEDIVLPVWMGSLGVGMMAGIVFLGVIKIGLAIEFCLRELGFYYRRKQ